jgi:rhamnulokinase
MTQKNFRCIAVDMGAASIRIMLGSIANGRLTYEEKHRFNNEIITINGHERWNINLITREIKKGIQQALTTADGPVQSIAVDSWGVDFVLLDKQGNLLDEPVAYRDARTRGMQERWSHEMSPADTFTKTGINFYDFNTLFHLLAIRDSDLIPRIGTILFMPCYINYILSGQMVNETTIASTSQLLNVKGNSINSGIAAKLNLDPKVFGRIIPAGTTLGPYREAVPADRNAAAANGDRRAEQAGTGANGDRPVELTSAALNGDPPVEKSRTEMEGDTPTVTTGQGATEHEVDVVTVCGHDTACAVTAIPADEDEFAFIATGTWCIVGTVAKEPVTTEYALNEGFTNERGYLDRYRVLKNINGLWLVQGLKASFDGRFDYNEIEKMALGSDCSNLVYPENEMFYNPEDMQSAFDRFFAGTGQPPLEHPADYFKCAYDSLCMAFRLNMEKLEQMMGRNFPVLHLTGGGCQSEYLSSQTATICERKVVSGPVEGATIGNIIIQGIAAGGVKNLEEARQIVRDSFNVRVYQPDPAKRPTEERFDYFKKLK